MTFEFQKEIDSSLAKLFAEANTPSARERVKDSLTAWVSFTARKKPVANLDQRLEEFCKRIGVLADSIKLAYIEGKLVVSAAGDGETTLRMLERGTDWFDPAANLNDMIAGAILERA